MKTKPDHMDRNKLRITLVITGALLFNALFWHEKMGINTVLYDVFALASLFALNRQAWRSVPVRWLLMAHLLCLAMVVLHNTPVSKLACLVTIGLLAGFAAYAHRSAWYAAGSVVMNALLVAASFAEQFKPRRQHAGKRKRVSRAIRFAFIPLMLLLVFFMIYSAANDAFGRLADSLQQLLNNFLVNLSEQFSAQRLFFLLAGMIITGTLLLRANVSWFEKKESLRKDELYRNKRPYAERELTVINTLAGLVMGRFAKGMLALKNEHTTGVISLLLLNGLLLIVNGLDIYYLWFNFQYRPDEAAYKMVHEGTELLIASIVLAMILLFFFFKGNLNFYQRNRWLKVGAYAWIVQNAILVVSVGIRDYHYIAKHGLAYKRIGVLFFLAMVLVGLVSVWIKIARKRTGYFLFRVNAWAGIVLLVLATTVHWDEMIARYNLKRSESVPPDMAFLLTLSDKVLPLLENNRQLLEREQRKKTNANGCDAEQTDCYIERLEKRKEVFVSRQQQFSWLSWNYADNYTNNFYNHRAANLSAANR